MTEDKESEQNKRLRSKFNFEKHGFYDVTPFVDVQIGFSCKKRLHPKDIGNVSLIGVYIPNREYNDQTSSRKAFYITATYGQQTQEGIRMRSDQNLYEPLDAEYRDEYFYDVHTEKLYKGKREIDVDDLLNEVYEKHIKTTKPLEGLFLRMRLRFWRYWLPWILEFTSKFFHYVLLLISGDRYTYKFLFQEESLNGTIISSKMERRIGRNMNEPQVDESEKEAKKIDFFGNKVPQWPIVFYSALHLTLWFLAKYFEIKTDGVESFLSNSFLIVLYVIVSFWLIETVLPFFLKKLIKFSSTLSFLSAHKKVMI